MKKKLKIMCKFDGYMMLVGPSLEDSTSTSKNKADKSMYWTKVHATCHHCWISAMVTSQVVEVPKCQHLSLRYLH